MSVAVVAAHVPAGGLPFLHIGSPLGASKTLCAVLACSRVRKRRGWRRVHLALDRHALPGRLDGNATSLQSGCVERSSTASSEPLPLQIALPSPADCGDNDEQYDDGNTDDDDLHHVTVVIVITLIVVRFDARRRVVGPFTVRVVGMIGNNASFLHPYLISN